MLRTRRTSRIHPGRRTLHVEALEDRTLLNGTVTAVLHADTGLLQITDDAADNQFTMAPAPTPGQLRIAGEAETATSINGADFADFALADVTAIEVLLQDGADRVLVTDFDIPGDLTIVYELAVDSITLSGVSANRINLVFAGMGEVTGSGHNEGMLPPVGSGGFGSGSDAGMLPPAGGTLGVTGSANPGGDPSDHGSSTGANVTPPGTGSDSLEETATTSLAEEFPTELSL